MTPIIAPATPPDLPAIFDLLDRSKLPRDGLGDHIATTLVARDGRHLVGTAALELYGASALLRSVAVAAEQRGRGLGQALTSAALDLARRRGVRTVYLLTETAADFFPKFGFRPIPRSEVDQAVLRSTEFTTACPASALVMKLQLAQSAIGRQPSA
jgi:amino-acid N-acetyltransferase